MWPAGIDQKHPCSHFSLTWGDRAARCQHSPKRQGELDWGQGEQSVIFLLNLFEITGALSSRGSFFSHRQNIQRVKCTGNSPFCPQHFESAGV